MKELKIIKRRTISKKEAISNEFLVEGILFLCKKEKDILIEDYTDYVEEYSNNGGSYMFGTRYSREPNKEVWHSHRYSSGEFCPYCGSWECSGWCESSKYEYDRPITLEEMAEILLESLTSQAARRGDLSVSARSWGGEDDPDFILCTQDILHMNMLERLEGDEKEAEVYLFYLEGETSEELNRKNRLHKGKF